MIHMDYKRLPLLKGQSKTGPREHMFVTIDDFSPELFATVMPDKTAGSAARFLEQVLEECARQPIRIAAKNFKGIQSITLLRSCARGTASSRKSPARFVNGHNWVKPPKVLGNLTPGK